MIITGFHYSGAHDLDRLDDWINLESIANDSGDDAVNREETNMEPHSFKEAMASENANLWQIAMDSEIASLKKTGTWELVELPKGRRPITRKWVYKLKLTSSNQIERYKARLVARGFTQVKGFDCEKTFSPVVRMDSVRTLLVIANQLKWTIEQFDVRTAFLNGDITEDIFMQQPQGYEDQERRHMVCKLRKSLYGLKQVSNVWNKCFTSFLTTSDSNI